MKYSMSSCARGQPLIQSTHLSQALLDDLCHTRSSQLVEWINYLQGQMWLTHFLQRMSSIIPSSGLGEDIIIDSGVDMEGFVQCS